MAVAHEPGTDTETLTIVYGDTGDGWITAQIVEIPAAVSQGRTRAEAKVQRGFGAARSDSRAHASRATAVPRAIPARPLITGQREATGPGRLAAPPRRGAAAPRQHPREAI